MTTNLHSEYSDASPQEVAERPALQKRRYLWRREEKVRQGQGGSMTVHILAISLGAVAVVFGVAWIFFQG
jgi:hypothetical protein